MKTLKLFLRVLILAGGGLFVIWGLISYWAVVMAGRPGNASDLNWTLLGDNPAAAYVGLLTVTTVIATIFVYVLYALVAAIIWVFKND